MTRRTLIDFFTSVGLLHAQDTSPHDAQDQYRRRLIESIPPPLAAAIAAFDAEQSRNRGQLSALTLGARIRVLRDLALHLATTRTITGWAETTTGDLESFLAIAPRNRHSQTYILRRFFSWARRRRLILTDPTPQLRLGAQPGFTGTLLSMPRQRELFQRWTTDTTPPHERLTGLLALLHAASNAEIRCLTVDDIDHARQRIRLAGRPQPTPLDPATWNALQACLNHRQLLRTLNPHVIVTTITRTRTTAADSSYLTRLLSKAATTPSVCRHTRLAQLVNDLDPKMAATALGMHDSGLLRYLADNVDRDRLNRTVPTFQH